MVYKVNRLSYILYFREIAIWLLPELFRVRMAIGMSLNKLPIFLKKKKLLDDPNLPAAECRTYGNLFLEAGWLADALDFFLKGNVTEGLEQLQALALDTGDAFLLERLLQAQGREAPELWEQVAARATALQKFTMAKWASDRAGKDFRAEAANKGLGENSLRPMDDDHADHA